MLNRLVLLRLKARLWRYKRSAKYYNSIRVTENWYKSTGIPTVEDKILVLECKINKCKIRRMK